MQIKSWQIALLSIPFAAISETYRYAFAAKILNFLNLAPSEVFIKSMLSHVVFFGLPVLLLYIGKTKKLGAVLSIIVGIGWTILASAPLIFLGDYKSIPIFGLILAFAGLYYFWKKV